MGDFLIVAGANTLSTPDMLRMHQITKPLTLAIFYLQIMRLITNQRQVVIIISILHAKLTICIHAAVDHLRVVIIPLRLYLMAHILLKDIIRLI